MCFGLFNVFNFEVSNSYYELNQFCRSWFDGRNSYLQKKNLSTKEASIGAWEVKWESSIEKVLLLSIFDFHDKQENHERMVGLWRLI